MTTVDPSIDPVTIITLEAFADTIIPGEKRSADDVAIAGVSTGGGAVAAGAVDLLMMPAGGLDGLLDGLVVALNEHAGEYARRNGIVVEDPDAAFVTLDFDHRIGLLSELIKPGHPEKEIWVALVMFCNMAFDTGAHLHTTEALAAGHPGLVTMGFEQPDSDGLWRFPDFSYRRALADLHPNTTPTGSPA